MAKVTSGLERFVEDATTSPGARANDSTGNATCAPDSDASIRAISAPGGAADDGANNPSESGGFENAFEATERKKVYLNYEPFQRQRQFHGSPAKYRLFGGAAGPGKSKALLMEAIVQALEHPGANTLVMRRTYPELEQSLLLYFRRDVPRELYRSFNESRHTVTWHNGATTRFGYCASEADVYQYQGAEFLFIGIDELTHFTLRQWQFLTSRNRCPLPGSFPCMAGATNPGNIGHAWVKALWIDKQPPPGMEDPGAYDPADYAFVPARVWDNPIYAHDENYLKTLTALPSHLRRAFLDGDWGVFAGQYFDRFDPATQVIRPEHLDWKAWWPRWVSLDWGFEHPAAVYWHAAIPSSPQDNALRASAKAGDDESASFRSALKIGAELPRMNAGASTQQQQQNQHQDRAIESRSAATKPGGAGIARQIVADEGSALAGSEPSRRATRQAAIASASVVTYRELVTRHTAPRELAQAIIDRSFSADGAREKIDAVYLSPDAFARRTDEASIAEQMGDIFAAAGWPRPAPADDDRVGGWMLMYQMLEAGEWRMTENCIELIRTLPALVRDTVRVEDVEKIEGDDPADAARYGLKSRYGIRRSDREPALPLESRIAARVTSADPTIRAIQFKKAEFEETRRARPFSFARRRPRR